ncbi:MAG: hypothetical protein KGI33_04585 [Thaumarchaeota archaeon]|nr:hypothetical protein [Nitrososphaerota archaeon]
MSMIEVTRDVKNPLLSRREITCTFKGLAGRLKKIEAAEMIAKQFGLEGKIVIPINLKNDTGRPLLSGTFYVYEDEKMAREHLKEAVFKRMEKAKTATAKEGEAVAAEAPPAEEKKEETK